jgi:hypothetical protein
MTPMSQEVKAVLQEVLQEAMEPVLAELYTLNRRVENIEKTMATKEELEVIRQSMATKEDIADLPFIKQAVIELSDTVNLIIERQDRQEKIIELLSVRSIRHEAEISELHPMIQS